MNFSVKILLNLYILLFSITQNAYSQALQDDQKWVTDRAYIIPSNTEYRLTQNAIKHEQETGNQLVTVTVHSLRGETIEDFSLRLANEWGIGIQDKNNGVLFLIAPKEKEVRIEVGTGLENILTNEIAREIEEQIIPAFQQGNMESGIVNGHRSIIQALNGDYAAQNTSLLEKIFNIFIFIILFPIIIFIALKKRTMIANIHPAFRGGGGNFRGGGSSGKW